MDIKLSLNDRRPIDGYVADAAFRETYYRNELTQYWNFDHFCLVEPFRDAGNDTFYRYLLGLRDENLLVAETHDIVNHPIDDTWSNMTVRCLVAGLHFFAQRHPSVMADFLNYDAEISCGLPTVQKIFHRYRDLFSYNSSRITYVIIDHERNVTTELIQRLFRGHDRKRYLDVIYIGGDRLSGALEYSCRKQYLPIARVESFFDLGDPATLQSTLKNICHRAQKIVVGDSSFSHDVRIFLDEAKLNENIELLYA